MLLLERICMLTRAPRQAHSRVLLSSKKAIKSFYQFFFDACLNLAQIVFVHAFSHLISFRRYKKFRSKWEKHMRKAGALADAPGK
jgi:hypothetical protein